MWVTKEEEKSKSIYCFFLPIVNEMPFFSFPLLGSRWGVRLEPGLAGASAGGALSAASPAARATAVAGNVCARCAQPAPLASPARPTASVMRDTQCVISSCSQH